MIRNFPQAGPSTSDLQPQQDPPVNVSSKVAEVFLTAGHAFQKLGDLTLQLHNTDDQDESKWSETDVEQLRESLTKFAHELDTISERVQSRTVQIVKTDIKRRVMMPAESIQRTSLGNGTAMKRAAPGGPLPSTQQMQAKRLVPINKPSSAYSTAPRMPTMTMNSNNYQSAGPSRLTSSGSAYAPTRLAPISQTSSSGSAYAPQRTQQQINQPESSHQYFSSASGYSPNH